MTVRAFAHLRPLQWWGVGMSAQPAEFIGKTCWEVAALGGCPICWGRGKSLGITDADWRAAGPRAKRTEMSCGYCRGTGRDHRPTHVGGKSRLPHPTNGGPDHG